MVDEVAREATTIQTFEDLWLSRSWCDHDDDASAHVEARQLEHGALTAEFTLHGPEAVGMPAVLARAQSDLGTIVAGRRHGLDQPIE